MPLLSCEVPGDVAMSRHLIHLHAQSLLFLLIHRLTPHPSPRKKTDTLNEQRERKADGTGLT